MIDRRQVLAGAAALVGASALGRPSDAWAAGCGSGSGTTGVQALMADLAANLPGVNTHINYLGTVYDRSYNSIIKPRLLELGIRHIRDNPASDTNITVKNRYVELARAGIKLLMVTWDTANCDLDYVKSLNSSGLQVVEAVEPPNERDLAWGSSMPTQMFSYMRNLYTKYKSDSATKNITILGPAFANTRDAARNLYSIFSNSSKYMDVGNVHDYCGRDPEGSFGGGWGISLSDALDRQKLGSAKPVWASENGYKMSNSNTGHPAVTQRAAAKYLPRQFLSHMQRGTPRMYMYQLINNNDEDFGLLNNNGTPRQQFYAVKNFIRLFSDRGATFTPGTLKYSLTGNLSGIQQVLLQKRSGRFYLAVWQGVQSSRVTTIDSGIGDMEYSRRALSLQLGLKITAATVYEPSFSSASVKTYTNPAGIASIPLSVPDHLQVIELIPAGCT
ncbi:MAG: hypothetical protein WAS21_33350 [Geminicoccaceae bacterium]